MRKNRSLPTPVSRLFADAQSAQVSRREVMKRAGALGLGAGMVSLLARGYGSSVMAQEATPQAAGWSLVMPEGLRTDLAGASIVSVQEPARPSNAWEIAAAEMFSEATGIEVTVQQGIESATDRLTSYRQLFEAEADDIDVLQIDVIWPGILAPHAVDLSEAIGWQEQEYFERIVENNTVDGSLVGIPWFTDAGLLYYRTDLLEAAGLSGPPATWTELEDAANAIIEAQRSSNPDFQGFVWQGAPYEGLTCDALEWQWSQGGGRIIDPDGTVTVNNAEAVAAFERAAGWVGTISPEGVTTYMEEEARAVWQGGNSAFMRNWPYAFALGQAEDSSIRDLFDVTQLPMGEGEGAQHAATLGGWQAMVSRYSANVDAAIEYTKFMTSLEVMKSRAIEFSYLPTIASIYEDPDVLAAQPYYARLGEVFSGGAIARPSTPSADLYPDVSAEYYTAVNQILTGEAEAASVVEDLQGALEDIVAQV
ncbi:ABC transporter substrate-binding protein [soil metagenome]